MADPGKREQLDIVADLANPLELDRQQRGTRILGTWSTQSGIATVSPASGTWIRLARYQLSIAVSAPGWPQSAI